jgi:hypothetical protein
MSELSTLYTARILHFISPMASRRGGQGSRPGRHVGFLVDKAARGLIFSEYFGFLANQNSTNFSIIIITRGWHNRPIGGRSAEWTQLDSMLSMCLINETLRHEGVWGSGCIEPHLLDLDISWR